MHLKKKTLKKETAKNNKYNNKTCITNIIQDISYII